MKSVREEKWLQPRDPYPSHFHQSRILGLVVSQSLDVGITKHLLNSTVSTVIDDKITIILAV